MRKYAATACNPETLWDTKELEKGSKKDWKIGTASVKGVVRLEPFSERWLGQEEKVVRAKNVSWEQVFSQTRTTVHQIIVAQDRLEASRKRLILPGYLSCRTAEHTLVGMLKFIYVFFKKRKENPLKAADHESMGLSELLAAGCSKVLPRKPCCTFVLSLFSL